MLSITDAVAKVEAIPRVDRVQAAVTYGDIYILRVTFLDADEAEYDPFYSVNMNTQDVREYSFLHDGDPGEVTMLFLALEDDDE